MGELLRPGDAARRLGVSTRTLARYASDGIVAAQRTPGGHHRYDLDDLDRTASTPGGDDGPR